VTAVDLRGLRVAVTGASGFCGGVVARAASEAGADVVCLSRRPGPVGKHIPWDAARDKPDLAGADIVLHLAAAVGDAVGRRSVEAAYHAVNVVGTGRLLEAARSRPVVWVSSASVYRPQGTGPIAEGHPVDGQPTVYGRTKAAGEALALAAGAVVLRPRAVYGEGDPHLLPRLLGRVRGGVALLPGPDVRLSLTAVQNLAGACLAAPGWPAGAYNITDGRPYERDAAVRAVLAAHGRRVRVGHVPVGIAYAATAVFESVAWLSRSSSPYLSRYAVDQLARGVVLDIAKATALGWRPSRTLADYLRTVASS
jgi:nucleoside-diphosphate-sugar epimerase